MKEFSAKKATLSAIAVLLSVLLLVTVSFGTYYTIWSFINLMYYVAVAALIALNLFAFLFMPQKACEIIGIVTIAVALSFGFIHFIYIIIDISDYIYYYGGFNGFVNIVVNGFLPLALLAAVSVAYIICKIKIPNDKGGIEEAPAADEAKTEG